MYACIKTPDPLLHKLQYQFFRLRVFRGSNLFSSLFSNFLARGGRGGDGGGGGRTIKRIKILQ
jgi:hypothetical protein